MKFKNKDKWFEESSDLLDKVVFVEKVIDGDTDLDKLFDLINNSGDPSVFWKRQRVSFDKKSRLSHLPENGLFGITLSPYFDKEDYSEESSYVNMLNINNNILAVFIPRDLSKEDPALVVVPITTLEFYSDLTKDELVLDIKSESMENIYKALDQIDEVLNWDDLSISNQIKSFYYKG